MATTAFPMTMQLLPIRMEPPSATMDAPKSMRLFSPTNLAQSRKGRKVNLLILKGIFLASLAPLREILTYYETIKH